MEEERVEEEVINVVSSNRKSDFIVITLILLIVVSLSVGFAYLSSNLKIRGTAGIQPMSWDVHFENVISDTDTNAIINEPASIDASGLNVNFDILFKKPKDSYSFTVEIVNKGTLDAKIEEINLNGIDATNSKFLSYEVTYSDGEDFNVGDVLKAGERREVLVTVVDKEVDNAADLPHETTTYNLGFNVRYVQAD